MILNNIKWVDFQVWILKDPFKISEKCIYMCDTSNVSKSRFVMVWVEDVQFFLLLISLFLFQIKLPSTTELCNFDFQSTSNSLK